MFYLLCFIYIFFIDIFVSLLFIDIFISLSLIYIFYLYLFIDIFYLYIFIYISLSISSLIYIFLSLCFISLPQESIEKNNNITMFSLESVSLRQKRRRKRFNIGRAEAKFVGFQRIALLCGRLLQHSCVFRPMSGSFIFVLIITFF